MTEFDKLSRGKQFLILLERDYEILVKEARIQINHANYVLEHYQGYYNGAEKESLLREIEYYKKNIEDYSPYVEGGVENEQLLTESIDSESPPDRYTGPTCTTV